VALTHELTVATRQNGTAKVNSVFIAPETDREMVAGLQRGDEKSFERLLRSCGPQVLAIARRYLNSEADAADCFQETFIAVFKSIDSYAGQSSLRQWVRGVAVKQCLMALRKRKRTREESIESMLPSFDESGRRIASTSEQQHSSVETELDSATVKLRVRKGIDKLPDDYRTVLLLRDIDGLNTRETAAILGIEINAVKTRLHRARTALRYILRPILEQTACDANV